MEPSDLDILDAIIERTDNESELRVLRMLREFIDEEDDKHATLYKDSVTGRFVTKEYAEKNPATTYAHSVNV